MKKHLLASTIGLAILAAPGAALAQGPGWRVQGDARYRDGDSALSYYEVRRVAYDEGFREGLKEGDKDRRQGDPFRYEDERSFRDADKGYRRTYGDRDRYRQAFRSGYADGYGQAYRGRGRGQGNNGNGGWGNGGNGGWGNGGNGGGGNPGGYGNYSPAFDNGARDGYEKGVEDSRKNRSFDPLRHSWYRAGDRHYESRYGQREQYKDIYRRGFQEGYERGYRAGGYRW